MAKTYEEIIRKHRSKIRRIIADGKTPKAIVILKGGAFLSDSPEEAERILDSMKSK